MIAVSSHQLPRLLAADHQPLVNYESLGRDALLSIPTADHYLPLLSVLGTRVGGERLGFPVKGVNGGSISMLAVQIG
jgi:4,5-DOPA dioxygenase extradiol